MAIVDIYLGAGVTDFDSILNVNINYIDDKQVNKATFTVYESLNVQSGDTIRFYDTDLVLQFKGKCKEVNPLSGDDIGMDELICYTFEIELTERTVTEVFLAQPLETFISTIVTTYSSLNFATTLSTGITVEEYLADKKPAFDLVKDLIDRSPELTYYIDYTTDTFHLIKKGDTESSVNLIQRDNALFDLGWKQITDKQCTVLNLLGGKEVRNGFSQSYNGTGAQTTFDLDFAPSNMKVVVGGVEQDLQVSGQNTGDYTIIVKDKLLIFVAGSIPAVGVGNIVVTYDYEIPIDLSGIEADPELIDQYGVIERTITRNHLKSVNDALDYGYEYVNQWAKPLFGNTAEIISTLDASLVIPGNKIYVEDSDHEIEGAPIAKFFLIKQVSYTLDGLKIIVGDIRNTAMDFIKELKYGINQLEASNINSSVITKSYFLNDNITITATDELELQLVQELPDDAIYFFDEITGLTGWWKGDGTAIDDSDEGNNGTWSGTETYSSGKQFDEMFDFDGSSSVNLSSDVTISTLGGSISLWYDYNSSGLNPFLGETTTTDNFFGINNSSYLFRTDDGEQHGLGTATLNTLTHVVLVFDNDVYTLYENNIQLLTGNILTTSSLIVNTIGTGFLSNFFTGSIGDVRSFNRALTTDERTSIYNNNLGLTGNANIEEIGLGEDRPFSSEITGLVGWWRLDNDTLDYSVTKNDGTWSGTEGYDVGKQFDLAGNFNGSSDLTVTQTDFSSFSIWVYPTTPSVENFILTGPASPFFLFQRSNNNWSTFVSGGTQNLGAISFNTWTNIIGINNGSNWLFYINNTLVLTTSTAAVDLTKIGDRVAGSRDFEGKIQDVRIYSKALSLNERTRIYNSGLGIKDNAISEVGGVLQTIHYKFQDANIHNTNPDDEIFNLNAYYDLNGNSLDGSGNGNDGTDTDITYVTGKVGQAADFNGSSSKIQSPTGIIDYPFTMMSWVNKDTNDVMAVVNLNDSTSSTVYSGIGLISGTAFIVARNTTTYLTQGTDSISIGQWHHIAGVFESPTLRKLYIDGELNSIGTDSVAFNPNIDISIIGVLKPVSPTNYLDGKVDDTLIVARAMTTNEIKARYNEGNGKTDKFASWETIE